MNISTFSLGNLKNTKVVVTSFVLLYSVLLTSCGSGTSGSNLKIAGINGPKVILLGDNILIDVVFENISIQAGARYGIPKYPNSYIEVSPDLESNGTLMAFSVSLDDIFAGRAQRLDPLTLPGGRPVPGVSGGTLPAVAFSVPSFHNIGFYIGPKVFGVWIPLPQYKVPAAILTTRFYTGSKRVGNLSLLGTDANGENAGLFLALVVSSREKRMLEYIAD